MKSPVEISKTSLSNDPFRRILPGNLFLLPHNGKAIISISEMHPHRGAEATSRAPDPSCKWEMKSVDLS